jgi:hypothetical protein
VIEYADATSIGSIDLAVSYAASDAWKCAAVLKNIGSKMEWQMPGFLPGVTDRPLPSLTVGSSYTASLAQKPLVWALDARIYALDGTWKELDRTEMVLCTGAEWHGWDNFRVRAGLCDLSFTSDAIRRDDNSFGDNIGGQITAGFSYRPAKKRNGLWINYAAATDKIWAGVDQQLDVTLAF